MVICSFHVIIDNDYNKCEITHKNLTFVYILVIIFTKRFQSLSNYLIFTKILKMGNY